MFTIHAKAKDKKGKQRLFNKTSTSKNSAELKAISHAIDNHWTHFEVIQIRQIVKKLNVVEDEFRVF